MKLILVALLSIIVVGNVQSQMDLPEEKVNWKFYGEEVNGEYFLVGKITMAEHWHIYPLVVPEGAYIMPTEVSFEKSDKFELVGKTTEPKPHFIHDDKADEDIYYHEGTVYFRQKIKVKTESDFEVKGTFVFQTCDDVKCLAPYTADLSFKVKVVSKEQVEASNTIEDKLVSKKDGIGKDQEGNDYVNVNNVWYKVPEGNSASFYKKYLELGGSHE